MVEVVIEVIVVVVEVVIVVVEAVVVLLAVVVVLVVVVVVAVEVFHYYNNPITKDETNRARDMKETSNVHKVYVIKYKQTYDTNTGDSILFVCIAIHHVLPCRTTCVGKRRKTKEAIKS